MRHREHPEAANEFDAAVRWYEVQQPGVGVRLIARAEQARHNITYWPDAAPLLTTAPDGTMIRAKAIRGYPYRIVYTIDADVTVILAYAHERRRPGYWLDRLGT